MGPGSQGEFADSSGVSSRSANGFYLLFVRRRAWVYRRRGGFGVVLSADYAGGPKCPDGAGQSRTLHLHGGSRVAAVSCIGQCGNGSRPDAGYRYSPSVDEFGRVEYLVDISDAGAGQQRQVEKVCKLRFDVLKRVELSRTNKVRIVKDFTGEEWECMEVAGVG